MWQDYYNLGQSQQKELRKRCQISFNIFICILLTTNNDNVTRLLQSWIKKQKKLKKVPDIETIWQN